MGWKDHFVRPSMPADGPEQIAQEQAYAQRRTAFYQQIAQAQALPERTLYYHEADTRTLLVLGLGINKISGTFTHIQAPMTAHEPDGTHLYEFVWHSAPLSDLLSIQVCDGNTPVFSISAERDAANKDIRPGFFMTTSLLTRKPVYRETSAVTLDLIFRDPAKMPPIHIMASFDRIEQRSIDQDPLLASDTDAHLLPISRLAPPFEDMTKHTENLNRIKPLIEKWVVELAVWMQAYAQEQQKTVPAAPERTASVKAQAISADATAETNPAQRVSSPPVDHASRADIDDVLATIEKLASLHDAGILTDEEFTEKKKQLLAKI